MAFWDNLTFNDFYHYVYPPIPYGIPLNVYLYFFTVLISLILAVNCLFIRWEKSTIQAILLEVFWCMWICVGLNLLIQIPYQFKNWQEEVVARKVHYNEVFKFTPITKDRKFSDFILLNLPYGTPCRLGGNYLYIRYQLYPHLVHQDNTADCIILHEVTDPLKYIPKSFSTINYNAWSLIAIRKKECTRR